MTTNKFGRIITNTRPGGLEIFLDGRPVLDTYGKIAKTPAVILNVSAGTHNVTFSKLGWDTTTVMVNVEEGADCYARAILATKSIRYPLMLEKQEAEPQAKSPSSGPYQQKSQVDSQTSQLSQPSQPVPGWPTLPTPQIPFGNLVANTIPDGAEIYIDGQPIYDTVGKILTTPASVLGIVVGKHTLTFRKKGYSDENIEVYIENGLYSEASTILRPIMTGSKPIVILAPEQGEITIDTSPAGAHVYIDGKDLVDNTGAHIRTPVTLTLNAGWHDMVVYLEQYCREHGPVYVYPNTRTYVHKDLFKGPCE